MFSKSVRFQRQREKHRDNKSDEQPLVQASLLFEHEARSQAVFSRDQSKENRFAQTGHTILQELQSAGLESKFLYDGCHSCVLNLEYTQTSSSDVDFKKLFLLLVAPTPPSQTVSESIFGRDLFCRPSMHLKPPNYSSVHCFSQLLQSKGPCSFQNS